VRKGGPWGASERRKRLRLGRGGSTRGFYLELQQLTLDLVKTQEQAKGERGGVLRAKVESGLKVELAVYKETAS